MVKEPTRYEEETFLDATIGNFTDCLENIVYNFQKYVNMLYTKIPGVVNDMKSPSSIESEEVLSFIIAEHEKILITNGIKFSVDCLNLLIRKYDSLRSELGSHHNNRYYICPNAYEDLFRNLNKLDIGFLRDNAYDERFKGIDTDFCGYMHSVMQQYEKIEYKADMNSEFTPDSLSMLLDNACMRIISILTQLKDLSEASTDLTTTLNIVKYIIDVVVAAFETTSTIAIRRIEDVNKVY